MSNADERTRVLVVDDHPIVRHGLRGMLSNAHDLEIVGEAENGAMALQQVVRVKPHVVLLDIRMPGQNGVHVIRQIKRVAPDTRVIMLTIHDDVASASRCLEAGADGYLLKQVGPVELIQAIRTVHQGQRVVAPELASDLIGQFVTMARERTRSISGLSRDELRILEGMAEGRYLP